MSAKSKIKLTQKVDAMINLYHCKVICNQCKTKNNIK